jgi:hypothetical protein
MSLLMSRVQVILEMTKPKLLAEEKYFLIRLLAVYNYEEMAMGGVVSQTIDELEKCLGMSDKLIKQVRDSLIVKNYLTNRTVPPNQKQVKGGLEQDFLYQKK